MRSSNTSRLTLPLFLAAFWSCEGHTHSTLAADSESTPSAFRVCIDPGHPSENNDGANLTNGLREVSVNWEIASRLKELLQHDGITVVMTKKSESEFITNKDRAKLANEAQANLFLRLHADDGASTGFTVYYPRKQGTAHGVTGPSSDVLASSKNAATVFHSAFAESLRGSLRDNGLRGEEQTFIGGKQGALTGSIFSKMPTVLVEMIFLTSRQDADWMKQESNKAIMAQALASAVRAVRDAR